MRVLHLPAFSRPDDLCGKIIERVAVLQHIELSVIVTGLADKGDVKYAGFYSNSDYFGISA